MSEQTRALTEAEIMAMTGMQRMFWLHAETRRLNECGWVQFDGITFGGKAIDAESLVRDGLFERRDHPVLEHQYEYRLTANGNNRTDVYADDPRYNPFAPSEPEAT